MIKKKFEDTKEIFRNRKSKDRQNNGQKKKCFTQTNHKTSEHIQAHMSLSLFLIVFNGFSGEMVGHFLDIVGNY
jgi:hypothetical protein